MLGRDLQRVLPPGDMVPLSSSELNVTDTEAVRGAFKEIRPAMVIHTAAATDVDACELHPEIAYNVNSLGSRNVARAGEEVGATVVYISTDYVFDGLQNDPYIEFDAPHPLNVYGKSKLAGERFVRELCRKHYIVRTSWLFGKNGKNFVRTIMRLGKEREDIRVVADQFGSPTYTYHLAQKIKEVVATERFGIYHITNSESCSWYQFANAVLRHQQSQARLVPIETADYPVPAPRPKNSVLRNFVLQLEGVPLLPPWQEALNEFFTESQ
jgi:dTDP-4-dehydrorhamnose reductase